MRVRWDFLVSNDFLIVGSEVTPTPEPLRRSSMGHTLTRRHQVSMSFGGPEYSSENSFDSNQVSGVSFIASSGDTGNVVQYPASSPWVIGVGGTNLNLDSFGNILN